MKAPPCNECRRCHRGPRCTPAEARSVKVCVTLPGRVYTRMIERVPWGERSSWVAALIRQELDS